MTNRGMRAAIIALAVPVLIGIGLTEAQAGECPREHKLTQPRKLEDKPELKMGRETLAVVKLDGWRGVKNLLLRTRRLTIEPGGLVPTHYHNDRPSIVYIEKGELIEHSTFCAVPVLHKAGEWTPEFGDFHGHWWENKGTVPAVVLSSDVIPPDMQDDPNM